MQLILYFIYYDKNKNPEQKKKSVADPEQAVELGQSGNGKAHNNIQDGKPNTQTSLNGHV